MQEISIAVTDSNGQFQELDNVIEVNPQGVIKTSGDDGVECMGELHQIISENFLNVTRQNQRRMIFLGIGTGKSMLVNQQPKPKPHGWYRQFEQRNGRKNIKPNNLVWRVKK